MLYLNRRVKICLCIIALVLSFTFLELSVDTAELDDAYWVIYNGIYNMSESIDVSECKLDVKGLSVVLNKVLKASPYMFYVDGGLSFTKDTSGYIKIVMPRYNMDKYERSQAEKYIKGEIEKILFYAPVDLDGFGYALYFHDYICTHFEYDDSLESNDLYSMLKNGNGTCQGYAYLYSALLTSVGVENDFAYSDKIKHIWNIVNVGGEWYHVDVTWDDTEKIFGYASHKNFLCSDVEIQELGHTEALKFENVICNSEKYGIEYLNYVNTSFSYLDGNWYAADNSAGVRAIVKYDFTSGEWEKVWDISGYWQFDDNRFYANCFSSVANLGGYIYFNYKNKLLRFDGDTAEEIYTAPEGEQLCFATATYGKIYMSLLGSNDTVAVDISPNGDVNGDKITDICDIIELSISVDNGTLVKNPFGADISKNEELDLDDVKALREILLGLSH